MSSWCILLENDGQHIGNLAPEVILKLNFFLNAHNRHSISRPSGRDMGCLL